jgi:hypothetical protein
MPTDRQRIDMLLDQISVLMARIERLEEAHSDNDGH